MTLDEKLQQEQYSEIWEEYCGFLDLSMEQYLEIQHRLMLEQLSLYAQSELGQRIMNNHSPNTIEEFRRVVPLTTYDDYADILMRKLDEALPAKPAIWIETTWEGGKHPVKVAPYTASMINCHKGNFLSCMILSTSNKRGEFKLRSMDNFLYGMAPLPYLTGIVPYVLDGELKVNFLPPTKDAINMGFGERNKVGFKLGMQQSLDLFFGLSSVITRMTESFIEGGSSGGSGSLNLKKNTVKMNLRLAKAWYNGKKNDTPILPKDIFDLKGLICAGTDSSRYKKRIEEYWGVKPLEIFGGTEPTIIGTETWSRNGMALFPDVCFYEFIPETEYEKNQADSRYIPKTYLINELVEGSNYELVISNFKGGAFMRYRVGDMFRCLSLTNPEDGIQFPQFAYVDRVPTVIDIAGFTRITETTITDAITLSRLDIPEWFAVKEFDPLGRAYMHLFLEVGEGSMYHGATKEIIKDQLTIYFRYIDADYKDLKRMLGIDPLKISILPNGSIEAYKKVCDHPVRKINPSPYDVTEILHIARIDREGL